jgi:hypothetical protein
LAVVPESWLQVPLPHSVAPSCSTLVVLSAGMSWVKFIFQFDMPFYTKKCYIIPHFTSLVPGNILVLTHVNQSCKTHINQAPLFHLQ